MKSLNQVIKENHIESNNKYRKTLELERAYKKTLEKKEKMLAYLIGAFIIVISCMCIFLLSSMEKDFVETCAKKGYSVQYCMDHM